MSKIYLLNNLKYEGIENLEVFGIENIESDIDLSKYDALVFTSKNAVYSIDSFNKEWKKIPAYSIAEKTSNVIIEHNGNLVFTGLSSHGNEFAEELSHVLKNKKVLYIKALKTVSNIVGILKENSIDLDELIAYKTSCLETKKILENNSIFIFTSPSSVECFFKNYKWDDSYKAIVIGKTTADYLPKNINYIVSNKTSIDECIKLAKQLLN
ncbi:uroporphyrinogen-III synthase [Poseidonibacter lekithochrous]|uniref:uroporphyrinogen-III synthase n=1 Tax=Poseidonibacter TaxID=2321187 RepID=UPI001C08841B|nr:MULTISPECIES: uroporphyrinogen-III synthase [Poseidonibacter]MBU3014811.1 uroporphyrinogen-III synthase [Poseidonibacter lekithochrous]MDO6828109.1 uroporphyrinogen-III synthase [Poseidonibacter sp. 1_MG-2023]